MAEGLEASGAALQNGTAKKSKASIAFKGSGHPVQFPIVLKSWRK
jgi:hypothetical protein